MEALSQFVQVPQLIAQLINFMLLVYLLNRFLYKPIVRTLDERASRIQSGLDRAQQAEQALAEANDRSAALLAEARKESQTLVANANTTAARIVEQARADAERQSNDMLARARSQMQLERQQLAQDLRAQVADLAILAASKVVEANMDDPTQRRLVEQVINDSNLLRPQGPSLS